MNQNPHPSPNESVHVGNVVVRYGAASRAFVIAMGLVALGLICYALVAAPLKNMTDYLGLGFVIVIFGLPIGYLALEFWVVEVQANETGVSSKSPWRKRREILWQDIDRVDYSATAMWYLIRTSKQGTVRCHLFMNNLFPLLQNLHLQSIPMVDGWEASKKKMRQGVLSFTSPPVVQKVAAKKAAGQALDFSNLDNLPDD